MLERQLDGAGRGLQANSRDGLSKRFYGEAIDGP
jgi:hypothetical protein